MKAVIFRHGLFTRTLTLTVTANIRLEEFCCCPHLCCVIVKTDLLTIRLPVCQMRPMYLMRCMAMMANATVL